MKLNLIFPKHKIMHELWGILEKFVNAAA